MKYLNQVVRGDCLKLMPKLPDGSVDMILCDLPYGTTANKWDTVIPFEPLWEQYKRVIKPKGAIVLTAQAPFSVRLAHSNLAWFKYEWVWEKNVSTGHMNANRAPMKKHEAVLVFADGQTTYNPEMGRGEPYRKTRRPINDSGSNYRSNIVRIDTVNDGQRYPTSILRFNREVGLHPTQKPVSLFEYLIRTYTNEGETVLDNCCGSGTTGVACQNTGRNFIQFDQDAEYCKIARSRLRAAGRRQLPIAA